MGLVDVPTRDDVWKRVSEGMRNEGGARIDAVEAATLKAMGGERDWGKYIMANPQLLAIPLGLLGMTRKSKFGKLAGLLAMMYGGSSIYNRYKGLQNPAIYQGLADVEAGKRTREDYMQEFGASLQDLVHFGNKGIIKAEFAKRRQQLNEAADT